MNDSPQIGTKGAEGKSDCPKIGLEGAKVIGKIKFKLDRKGLWVRLLCF
jgi:hypothetical protein